MEPGAVLAATCLASAFATALMGLWANYPIAVAPAMGHNFYFALVVAGPVAAGGLGCSWQAALGANCIAGVLFLVLSLVGLRERLIDAIPTSLKHAIAAGIGLLLALVGLEWAGVVRAAPGTLVRLGDLHHPAVLVAMGGTLLVGVLRARRYRGAIDRKSTRLNSSHQIISYAVFCLKKKKPYKCVANKPDAISFTT